MRCAVIHVADRLLTHLDSVGRDARGHTYSQLGGAAGEALDSPWKGSFVEIR